MKPVSWSKMQSPLGELLIAADESHITRISMDGQKHAAAPGSDWRCDHDDALIAKARQQLEEYFDGKRAAFDLPLAFEGTMFQTEVWRQLLKIPYGETISYGELARRIGRPGASRAAGLANGRNPIAIVVPCHRVIGANGSLIGYGGGLPRKSYLVELEASRAGLFGSSGGPATRAV